MKEMIANSGGAVFRVEEWWNIAPIEDVPWSPGEGDERRPFVQVFDAEAAEAMHAAFQNRKAGEENFVGLLIDWDHESTDVDKRTTGAGYIVETEVRADGLYGKPRLSADGLRDVEGGMFRFTSPTIPPGGFADLGGGRKRPTCLDSVAITNRPRCRTLKPISNAAGSDELIRNTNLPGTTPGEERRPAAQTNRKKDTTMLKLSDTTVAALLAKLGLKPEEATDESVAAALGDHPGKEDVTAYNNRAAALEGELADLALDHAGITDAAQRGALRPMLIANREGGKAALALIVQARGQAAQASGPVHNRAATGTPGGQRNTSEDARATRNRAVQEFQIANKCDFEAAWNAVRAAKPELFKEDK